MAGISQEIQYQDFSFLHDIYELVSLQNETSAVMKSEKIIFCEISAGLWSKALSSAINSVTQESYPHYNIVKEFINYFLNVKECTNIGLLEDFFWKLLICHPPKLEMDYYRFILCDYFIKKNGKTSDNKNLFFFLLDTLTRCLEMYNKNFTNKVQSNDKLHDNFSLNQTNEKLLMCFNELSVNEKIRRCSILQNFVCQILETNFTFWISLEKKVDSNSTRPLLSQLLWPEEATIGSVNKTIIKILNLFKLVTASNCYLQNLNPVNKLVQLIAEIIRRSERKKEIPNYLSGVKTTNFVQKLSLSLFPYLIELNEHNELNKINSLLLSLKPSWLRLLVVSVFLKELTGFQCPPELYGACEILELLVSDGFFNKRNGKVLLNENKELGANKSKLLKSKEAVLKARLTNSKIISQKVINKSDYNSKYELVGRLCVEMIQSYFSTYRTWSIYRSFKKVNGNIASENLSGFLENNFEWDCLRYNKDITTNICKLRQLIPLLKKVKEFNLFYKFYIQMVSMGDLT